MEIANAIQPCYFDDEACRLEPIENLERRVAALRTTYVLFASVRLERLQLDDRCRTLKILAWLHQQSPAWGRFVVIPITRGFNR
jgi:hypothetical protein